MINTTPLGSHKVMAEYAKFLFTRFVIKKGCDEVHIIFDNPGRLQNTPKYFEHKRRDKLAIVKTNHCCDTIPKNGEKTYCTAENAGEALFST